MGHVKSEAIGIDNSGNATAFVPSAKDSTAQHT
jgi:hypothetical protein